MKGGEERRVRSPRGGRRESERGVGRVSTEGSVLLFPTEKLGEEGGSWRMRVEVELATEKKGFLWGRKVAVGREKRGGREAIDTLMNGS